MELAAPSPGRGQRWRRSMWRNWLGNQRCLPSELVSPRGVDEVRAAVADARRRGLTIRAVGTGHAMAPLVPTTGMLLSTRRCDRLLSVEGEVIEVEAGMHLRELVAHAARHGLAVTGSAIYRGISVGGLTATGSHGTGLAGGCFSDRVTEMTFVDGRGRKVVIDETQPERLRAARVHLGALGILVSLKLRCEPDFRLASRHYSLPIAEGLVRLVELAREHDHVSAYWHPFTARMWVHHSDRSERATTFGARERRRHELHDRLLHGSWAPLVIDRVLALEPRLTPSVSRVSQWLKREYTQVWDSADGFHYLDAIPPLWLAGTVVPLEHATSAFTHAKQQIEDAAAAGRYPVNIAIYARFIGASESLLAMNRGRPSCCLELVTMPRTPDAAAFFDAMHEDMAARFDARPHWGKFFRAPALPAALYGDGIARFEAVRRELDPDGVFLNEWLRRVLEHGDETTLAAASRSSQWS